MDRLPGDVPPSRIPRQPSCHLCDHEDHGFFRCGLELGDGVICPCPPHMPIGIYTTS